MKAWAFRFVYLCLTTGLACANTLEFEVTTFGTGATKTQALDAARQQAVSDAIGAMKSRTSTSKRSGDLQLLHSKVIASRRLSDGSVEVEVKALVRAPSDSVQPYPLLGIAVMADQENAEDKATLELTQAVRERLQSNGVTPVDSDHPSVSRAMQRLQLDRPITTASQLKSLGLRSLPADVLCIVAVKKITNDISRSEVITQVVLLQAYGAGRHQISTVRASVMGDINGGPKAAQIEAAKQIARLATNFGSRRTNNVVAQTDKIESVPQRKAQANHGIILDDDW